MREPIRVQRRRTKGWKMPPNTIYVGRPSRWGNPFHRWMGHAEDEFGPAHEARLFRELITEEWSHQKWFLKLAGPANPALANAKVAALRQFRDATIFDRRLLIGSNLACWCPLDRPCHADVLLEVANR